MIENQFVRCEPDDPNRCQSTGQHGQCTYKAEEGKQYCPRHLACTRTAERKNKVRQYNLTKWQNRVEQFADHESVKSLRDEIGIVRMMLENVLNQCKDEHDLMLQSNIISNLASQIEKLVSSCHKLEESTGLLLDKNAALALGEKIVNVISIHVQDADSIEKIANDIILNIVESKK